MKIRLIIGKFTDYGGAEFIAFRFAKFLHRLGLLEEVLCFKSDVSEFSGKIKKLPYLKPGRFLKTFSFNKLANLYLKENKKSDIVDFSFSRIENCHIYRAGGGTHIGFLKKSIRAYPRFEKVKKTLTRFLNPINYYMPYLERKVFLSSKKIIAVSEFVRDEILRFYGGKLEDKVVVIPNSVDFQRFSFSYREKFRNLLRERYGLKKSSFVLGFASSNFKLKGLEHLIRALSLLPYRTELLIAGGRNSRRYWELAEKLGVGKRVRFLGKVKRMEDFYSVIDCLVHPSFYDTFGNVITEALSMRVPVVVSPYTGAKDFIISGKNGFILREISPSEIADAVKRVMELKPDFSFINLLSDEEVFSKYLKAAEESLKS